MVCNVVSYGKKLFASHPTKLEDNNSLSVLHDYLFYIFTVTLHTGGHFSIHILRMCPLILGVQTREPKQIFAVTVHRPNKAN
jgi:hypothetical protein